MVWTIFYPLQVPNQLTDIYFSSYFWEVSPPLPFVAGTAVTAKAVLGNLMNSFHSSDHDHSCKQFGMSKWPCISVNVKYWERLFRTKLWFLRGFFGQKCTKYLTKYLKLPKREMSHKLANYRKYHVISFSFSFSLYLLLFYHKIKCFRKQLSRLFSEYAQILHCTFRFHYPKPYRNAISTQQ